jgi:cell division protein FtsI/penicillin-binding protein 2
VAGVPIRNWDGAGRGSVTVRDILVYSLNTGAQWIASQLGAARFYDYIEAFGFGAPTGVRLNGEAGGGFRRHTDRDWSPTDLATNSFGQSITVTPLQMITAVAALANEGVLMRPQLVREIRATDGSVQVITPQPVRAVVSRRTADTMTDIMVSTWNQPALAANRIEGYTLAAKSGTADIPVGGSYSTNKTYASYIGFGPIPHPRFIVLVRIDQPAALYGGVVAAPVFRAITSELLTYLKIPTRDVRREPAPPL